MKTAKILTILILALGLMVFPAKPAGAAPMGTAFTYQGRLIDANKPADGPYDFEFGLYDAPSDGNQLGSTIDANEVDVIDGYFTVELDFGSGVFDGDARWLEINVRPGNSIDPNAFVTLSPRQKVTPTPYALYAKTAGSDNDWMVSGNDMYSIPSGNVGIGTTNPTSELTVMSASDAQVNIALIGRSWDGAGSLRWVSRDGSTTNWNLLATETYWSIVDSGGVRVLYAKPGGDVGIGTTDPDEKLHIAGSVKIVDGSQGANKVLTSDANGVASWQESQLPSGVIVMWSGSIGSIPDGWALCDGTNGTPDLRDRFIVGAGNEYAVTDTGGEKQHTLTIAEMPRHNHTYTYFGAHCCFSGNSDPAARWAETGTTGDAGGDQPHENRPPYYALAYIMKLP